MVNSVSFGLMIFLSKTSFRFCNELWNFSKKMANSFWRTLNCRRIAGSVCQHQSLWCKGLNDIIRSSRWENFNFWTTWLKLSQDIFFWTKIKNRHFRTLWIFTFSIFNIFTTGLPDPIRVNGLCFFDKSFGSLEDAYLKQGDAKASALVRLLRDFANDPDRAKSRQIDKVLRGTPPAGSA